MVFPHQVSRHVATTHTHTPVGRSVYHPCWVSCPSPLCYKYCGIPTWHSALLPASMDAPGIALFDPRIAGIPPIPSATNSLCAMACGLETS